jgi:hypothetical protein
MRILIQAFTMNLLVDNPVLADRDDCDRDRVE